MLFLSLDLEMNQPSGKIIQIGASIGDYPQKEIIERFNCYVNPNEPISPFITELTGITTQKVQDEGDPLNDAYQKLKAMILAHKPFINPVVWGGGDSEVLREQLGKKEDRYIFGRRWIDVKTIWFARQVALTGHYRKAGLEKSMRQGGLSFEGRPHDADDDAYNTLTFYFALLDQLRGESGCHPKNSLGMI